jgi:hypothetical protein
MAESQKKGEAFELRVKAPLAGHGFHVERDVLIAGNQVDLTDPALEELDKWEDHPAYDYALDALWAIAAHQCQTPKIDSTL